MFWFFSVLCAFNALYAYASEPLHFSSNIARSSLAKLKNSSAEALLIAPTDLNKDGLDEFITKPENCGAHAVCSYTIFAETDDSAIDIGAFEATHVLLGNEYKNGVRNLLVYNNTVNDFDYVLYTWHPETSKYRKVP